MGLLTGDNSINGEAPVVVMTTEVLRNMLYAGSSTLAGLAYVVLDEVHYLADRFRGAVWEEVIIHLPDSVRVVALSATVSNAEEFGDWLAQVRGGTTVIVDEHRPVPLWQHMLAGGRLYDLFLESGPGHGGRRNRPDEGQGPAGERRAQVNPELLRLARRDDWAVRKAPSRPVRGGRRPVRFRSPRRPDVIDRLDRAGLLPAITFIFSRAGCEAAVRQCLDARIRLTTPDEAAVITEIAERRTRDIPEADLPVLGYGEWLTGLQRGIAAHHAGMLPTFKEVVEELFEAGLVRAVFATETLALGINMPARTVVVERLDKWNGETHADLTPGEYTQLTGRAGRRGIDVEGHAVVLWQPGVDPLAVAGLAGTRTYPLNSSFRPSYNMAVNLVGQAGLDKAAALLESSFAQFQADRAVVGIARQARRGRAALAELGPACDRGDYAEYHALRQELAGREAEASRERSADRWAQARQSLEQLRRGDIILVPGGRRAGLAVVLDPGLTGPRGQGVPATGVPATGVPGTGVPGTGRLASGGRARGALTGAALARPGWPRPRARTTRCRWCSRPTGRSSGSPRPTSPSPSPPSTGCASRTASAPDRRSTAGTWPRPCGTRWPGGTSAAGRVRRGHVRRVPPRTRSPGCAANCASIPATAARSAKRTPGRRSSGPGWSGRWPAWRAAWRPAPM